MDMIEEFWDAWTHDSEGQLSCDLHYLTLEEEVEEDGSE